ncbi:hypothetical protein K435DRAFT_565032, partial [Dendrothele bispora CBS 962.96]
TQATTAPTSTGSRKAVWTSDNDRTLMASLKESKHAGFQTDNGGFHSDAYKAAAVRLQEEDSNLNESERQGAPKTADSCKTRFTTLKKDFRIVKILRNMSGFGWDPLKQLVTAPDSVWAACIKANPKYAKWQKKSFPVYDDMAELVDGHVATG